MSPLPPLPPQRPYLPRHQLKAKMVQTCPVCKDRIEIGTWIGRWQGGWAHRMCVQGETRALLGGSEPQKVVNTRDRHKYRWTKANTWSARKAKKR